MSRVWLDGINAIHYGRGPDQDVVSATSPDGLLPGPSGSIGVRIELRVKLTPWRVKGRAVMVTREQHGYKFEIEIMLPGGRVANGPLNGQKPLYITFKLADGEWERLRADHSDRSERECRQLLDAIRKDLIARCGREGIQSGEHSDDMTVGKSRSLVGDGV